MDLRRNLGKLSPNTMSSTVWRLKGAKSRSVVVGPRAGVDVSVLHISEERVMVASCDPISLIPSLGPEDSATMSLYEAASDVATSGQPPRYALFELNLPPHMSDQVFKRYWKSISNTCVKLGLSILGGHAGRFEGCDYSIVGGATMWTTCREDQYVTTSMARDGDDVILTKSAAYGATSVLARAFPRRVRKSLGKTLFEMSRQYLSGTNTVPDSLAAVKVGIHERGVTAIHDVTEGGVLAAIIEMAHASNLGGTIDMESIPVSEETLQICSLFHIDPLTSLGEGSLLITSRPNRTKRVTNNLESIGTNATVIGQLSSRTHKLLGTSRKARFTIRYPKRDEYWNAYWGALHKGWS